MPARAGAVRAGPPAAAGTAFTPEGRRHRLSAPTPGSLGCLGNVVVPVSYRVPPGWGPSGKPGLAGGAPMSGAMAGSNTPAGGARSEYGPPGTVLRAAASR